MKSIKLIIFDLDGTLIDSKLDIAASVNHTLNELGFPELSVETIVKYIGKGLGYLIKSTMGTESEEELNRARSIFIEHYKKHSLDNTVLFPGVLEVLQYFNDKYKAIITNKKTALTNHIIKELGIHDMFDIIIGGGDYPGAKPCPDSTNDTLKKSGAKKDEAIIVGDMHIDIETGRNAGILTCGVTYGLGDRKTLEDLNPDYLINNLPELKDIII